MKLYSFIVVLFLGWVLQSSAPERIDSPKKLMAIEEKLHELVNEYREKKNLNTLRNIPYMQEVARDHSLKMAQGIRSFGHRGWEQRADQVFEKLDVSMVAENVGFNKGYDDAAEQVFEGWKKSRRHKDNILNETFDITGIGVQQGSDGVYYYTQIFASYFED